MSSTVPTPDLGPPDPRFTDAEAWLVLHASILLAAAYDQLEHGLTDDEKLDYLDTSGRLFGLVHPYDYARVMDAASVNVTAAVLALDGWAAGRERYEQLSAEQQAALVASMHERGRTLETDERP